MEEHISRASAALMHASAGRRRTAADHFDCDGVLFDSWDANVAFYDSVLTSLESRRSTRQGASSVIVCRGRSSGTISSPAIPIDRRAKAAAAKADYSPSTD